MNTKHISTRRWSTNVLATVVISCCGFPVSSALAQADKVPAETKKLELTTISVKPEQAQGNNAIVQVDAAAKVQAAVETTQSAPVWSNEEAKQIGALLTGSWKSKAPLKAFEGGESFDVVINAAPIFVKEYDNLLYVETARADAINRPYRQSFWRLIYAGDAWNLQSLEFRRPNGQHPSFVGIWAAPQAVSPLAPEELVVTMTMRLTKAGEGFKGATSSRFATSLGGATEASGEISFDGKSITTADRGFTSTGKLAWGPVEGQSYAFEKFNANVVTKTYDNGIISITYPSKLAGSPAKTGELVTVNYAGYLPNGTCFDSSYERSSAFVYPFGSRMLEGWTQGMGDAQAGMQRRLILPAAQGYGDKGSRNGKVPPNSTLILDIDVLKVEPAPAPVVAPQPMTNDGTKIVPTEPPPEVKQKMEEEMKRRMLEKQKALESAPGQTKPEQPK
jgi:FKBP-type peptidyl-prolyl cis-trans isomerase FkpA